MCPAGAKARWVAVQDLDAQNTIKKVVVLRKRHFVISKDSTGPSSCPPKLRALTECVSHPHILS